MIRMGALTGDAICADKVVKAVMCLPRRGWLYLLCGDIDKGDPGALS